MSFKVAFYKITSRFLWFVKVKHAVSSFLLLKLKLIKFLPIAAFLSFYNYINYYLSKLLLIIIVRRMFQGLSKFSVRAFEKCRGPKRSDCCQTTLQIDNDTKVTHIFNVTENIHLTHVSWYLYYVKYYK